MQSKKKEGEKYGSTAEVLEDVQRSFAGLRGGSNRWWGHFFLLKSAKII